MAAAIASAWCAVTSRLRAATSPLSRQHLASRASFAASRNSARGTCVRPLREVGKGLFICIKCSFVSILSVGILLSI